MKYLLLLICLSRVFGAKWWPSGQEPMLGEQVDLVNAGGDLRIEKSTPNWIGQGLSPIGDFGGPGPDEVDPFEDPLNPTIPSINPVTPASVTQDPTAIRDREPLDEVEHIQPKQWSNGQGQGFQTTTQFSIPRRNQNPTTLARRNPSTQRYPPVTVAPPVTASVDEVFCDFGPLPVQSLCEWQNGDGALEWKAGTGLGTNWLGGPPSDSTAGTMEGGYAFIESSEMPAKDSKPRSPGGLLHSPQLGSTGVAGTCFTFKYAMDGLSSAGLRVLLHMGVDGYSIRKETQRGENDIDDDNSTIIEPPRPQTTNIADERVLWHAQYYTLGVWQQAQILYTFPDIHSLILEAVPVDVGDPSRLYRGYIAVDDIDLQPGTSCVGFCNFAGGFCDWSNDAEDDFDWTISRGSANPTTGPAMDSSTDRATAGGYAYIDSSFPRKPGDVAKLLSTSFPATTADSPMCMHFWFHMFGSGIGHLKVFVRHFRSLDAHLQEIWGLSGNAGNAWFMSEVTISSLDDYQIMFEASVGNTAMGDIAIDDVAFTPGACPVSPQVAAPSVRDCTFEVDECDWINSRDPDRVEWERVSTQALSARNQRKPYSNGHTVSRRNEYFLGLGRSRGGARNGGGGTAQLVSREMKGSEDPFCVTFWYFMFESFIDSTGPSLGVLRVLIQAVGDAPSESRPIWQLYNNQGPTWSYAQASIEEKRNFHIIFEGTWGPNRASGSMAIDDITFYVGKCTITPPSAGVRPEDCSFEKGLCAWENITSSGNDRTVTWQRAFVTHRPAQLLDKTFGATGDFVFFDIFTTNQKLIEVRLRSPIINPNPDEEAICFTFWFAAFGVEESTTLRVIRMSTDIDENNDDNEKGNGNGNGNEGKEPLWSLTAKGFNNPRPVWTAAQVTVGNRSPYRLVLEGTASNGGFAIDDIKFQPQACAIRPASALPVKNDDN
ncbi:MAM and LDL-receptor class A domain-containing protein 1-like [Athalia rosae]|uniref:MAM and LDL-receptor class A domain-containing protein 1-like n=1 Tax=Athalia rosae TaxID=37344 RepID=UPI002033CC7F|nr:MAM and LDL-receptor class A domain-containing protein 1-like [Athalia rosae]XP_048512154.1 MAM and LDL-receptor class A domain-containing protein 1-like [Athalia rosae]